MHVTDPQIICIDPANTYTELYSHPRTGELMGVNLIDGNGDLVLNLVIPEHEPDTFLVMPRSDQPSASRAR